jgi:hypothetical protein
LEMVELICEDSIPIAGVVVDMKTKLPNDVVLVRHSGISRLSRKRKERSPSSNNRSSKRTKVANNVEPGDDTICETHEASLSPQRSTGMGTRYGGKRGQSPNWSKLNSPKHTSMSQLSRKRKGSPCSENTPTKRRAS